LGFLPAEILFVGDTPSADIEGPRAVGMPAMLISDFEEYTRREAHRIGELPEDLLAAIQGAEYGSGTLHTPSSDAGKRALVIKGSGLGPLISVEEGLARLEEITVDDDSTDWAESELLGACSMAERLGVPVATLDDWRNDGKTIAFHKDADEFVYPVRQFEHARPIEGLDQVVRYFPSPEEAWEWMVTPNRYTNGAAPIDWLRSKHIEEVVRAAEGVDDFQ
jgi:hypothetical protein